MQEDTASSMKFVRLIASPIKVKKDKMLVGNKDGNKENCAKRLVQQSVEEELASLLAMGQVSGCACSKHVICDMLSIG